VLGKQILAIKVIEDWVIKPWRRIAHVATPEAELDMLRADMTLPFILGREGRVAIVLGEAARERTSGRWSILYLYYRLWLSGLDVWKPGLDWL
jgi:hypothetical protein